MLFVSIQQLKSHVYLTSKDQRHLFKLRIFLMNLTSFQHHCGESYRQLHPMQLYCFVFFFLNRRVRRCQPNSINSFGDAGLNKNISLVDNRWKIRKLNFLRLCDVFHWISWQLKLRWKLKLSTISQWNYEECEEWKKPVLFWERLNVAITRSRPIARSIREFLTDKSHNRSLLLLVTLCWTISSEKVSDKLQDTHTYHMPYYTAQYSYIPRQLII